MLQNPRRRKTAPQKPRASNARHAHRPPSAKSLPVPWHNPTPGLPSGAWIGPAPARRTVAVATLIACGIAGGRLPAEDSPQPLRIGAASVVINPEPGSWVQGAGVARRGEKQLDDMEAAALYLDDGQTALLLVSCDLGSLQTPVTTAFRESMAAATGVPDRHIIIACTHQHSGPVMNDHNAAMPVDQVYLGRLRTWLVKLAEEAVRSARPGKLGWATGSAPLGYNRRLCWADGSHSMHGDATRPDFAGLEGPHDHDQLAIFAMTLDDQPLAVLHHNTSHPTNWYGGGVFSADYPGVARHLIRAELGDVPVLYFNGAQGDIAMENQLRKVAEAPAERMRRLGTILAEETLRLRGRVEYHSRVKLGHAVTDLRVDIRLPSEAELAAARKTVAAAAASRKKLAGMEQIFSQGVIALQERYANIPHETLPIHAIRIGDVALVTQPCELYCQFGLDLKRRSPAEITAVVALADGSAGYCPTVYGVLGGGYSGRPLLWTRLEPFAGYRIVETAGPMLNRLWRDDVVRAEP